MDVVKTGCPSDTTLEMYLYQDLPYAQMVKVRAHMIVCRSCRKRLSDLREFNLALAKVPYEELPADLAENIVKAMDEWGDPTPAAAPDLEDAEEEPARAPSGKLRWAVGIAMVAVSSIVQWQLGDRYGVLAGDYLMGFKGMGEVLQYMVSGSWWHEALQVAQAVKTDGWGALEIVGFALPTQVAGVLVFGGIVTAVFISHLRGSRDKREGNG